MKTNKWYYTKWKVILFSTRWHIIFQHNHRPVRYRAATDRRPVGCRQRRSQQSCLCTKKERHSSHLRLSRNGCPWGNPWVLEKGKNRSEQDLVYKVGAVMSGGLSDLKPCEFPNLCEGERCRDGWWCFSRSFGTVRVWFTQNFWNKATPWILRNMWTHWRNWKRGCDG